MSVPSQSKTIAAGVQDSSGTERRAGTDGDAGDDEDEDDEGAGIGEEEWRGGWVTGGIRSGVPEHTDGERPVYSGGAEARAPSRCVGMPARRTGAGSRLSLSGAADRAAALAPPGT
jgi:hypothetical protein